MLKPSEFFVWLLASDRPASGSTSQTTSGKPESKYKQDRPESGAKSGSLFKPLQGAKQTQEPEPPYKVSTSQYY